ncbi:histidine phosphatase family protein [Streptomyces sp. NPDC058280]|uniref:histidine phosphatase family protein n=1 Tax=Streptomyces sp. NPDC058280 TaxID=3346419 RepID=UPI0036EEB9FC
MISETNPERSAADTAAHSLSSGSGWAPTAPRSASTTLLALRHGETALTPEKRFSGSGGTDPELSERGRWQADRAAASTLLAGAGIDAVVCSPLRRCRQTAAAVARRFGLDPVVEDGLREADFGDWEELTYEEVRARFPQDLQAWHASPRTAPTGSTESFADVARRIAEARDRLLSRYQGRTVLAVTHVTPVKALIQLALNAPGEALFAMELSPASFSGVTYTGEKASMRLYNDTSHLR